MNEIKFRAKIDDVTMPDNIGDWLIGGGVIVINNDSYIAVPVSFVKVLPNTIGQYVGLKDKNRKDIYEGDIVNVNFKDCFDNDHFHIAKIVYDDCCWWAEYKKEEDGIIAMLLVEVQDIEDIEVIGNIYDNPSLMEKGES